MNIWGSVKEMDQSDSFRPLFVSGDDRTQRSKTWNASAESLTTKPPTRRKKQLGHQISDFLIKENVASSCTVWTLCRHVLCVCCAGCELAVLFGATEQMKLMRRQKTPAELNFPLDSSERRKLLINSPSVDWKQTTQKRVSRSQRMNSQSPTTFPPKSIQKTSHFNFVSVQLPSPDLNNIHNPPRERNNLT